MAKRPDWLDDAVFYEIYPQSFKDTNGDGIGNINGITEKLPYIKELGCTAIWINPCFESPLFGCRLRCFGLLQGSPQIRHK